MSITAATVGFPDRFVTKLSVSLAALFLLCSCRPSAGESHQGYLEGDFVHLAVSLGGRLERLNVEKGARVTAGQLLFELEQGSEVAARAEAKARLDQARAKLADLREGQRPSEMAALEAQLAQARASAELATIDFRRTQTLFSSSVATPSDLDKARLTAERSQAVVDELSAKVTTARLGGRSDQINAAIAEVASAEAALAKAEWAVDQKTITAPADGLVFDTLYREGEYVATGTPVVTLLPPQNVKVRFFVPENRLATLQVGTEVRISGTGFSAPVEGRVSYVSPSPEFTPPVLYNRENRAKLVYRAEASVAVVAGHALHPGQPVDVSVVR